MRKFFVSLSQSYRTHNSVDALDTRTQTTAAVVDQTLVDVGAVKTVSSVTDGTMTAVKTSRRVDARNGGTRRTRRTIRLALVDVDHATRVVAVRRPALIANAREAVMAVDASAVAAELLSRTRAAVVGASRAMNAVVIGSAVTAISTG